MRHPRRGRRRYLSSLISKVIKTSPCHRTIMKFMRDGRVLFLVLIE